MVILKKERFNEFFFKKKTNSFFFCMNTYMKAFSLCTTFLFYIILKHEIKIHAQNQKWT